MSGFDLLPLGAIVYPTRPRVKPSDYPDLPFIGMEHVEAHSMTLLGTVTAATMKSSAVHFKPGDVLYGRLRPYLNKVYRPKFEGLCSAEFIVLPENERINGSYLQYFLNSSAFARYASHLNTGDRPRVDFDQLAPYKIPLPKVNEQRRIVAEIEKQFSRLDEAVASLKRVKGNLKRYKAATLKAAVTGRLVPLEEALARPEKRRHENGDQLLQRILKERRALGASKGKYKEPAPINASLSELPVGWTWATIESLTIKVSDGVHKKPVYRTSGVPFVTVKNLTAGDEISFEELNYISEEDHREFCKRTHPERGDLLVSKDGTLGVVRLVNTDRAFSIFVSVALVKPVLKEMSRYLEVALESPVLQEQMVPKGSGLQHIHLEDLRQDCVPVPPLPEQRRIVAEVDRRLSIVREVEAEVDANLKRAQALRQAVLAQAFLSVRLETRREAAART